MTPLTALFQEYEYTIYCNLYADMSLIQQVQLRVIFNFHNFNNEKTPRDKPHFVLQKTQKSANPPVSVQILQSSSPFFQILQHSDTRNLSQTLRLFHLYDTIIAIPRDTPHYFLERLQNRHTPCFFSIFQPNFKIVLTQRHQKPCETLICFFLQKLLNRHNPNLIIFVSKFKLQFKIFNIVAFETFRKRCVFFSTTRYDILTRTQPV